MGVAGVDLGPGVDHRDHRLAGPVGPVVAHLQRARAMAERPEVVGAVPTVAAQILVTLARHLVSSPGASCRPPRTRRRKSSIGTGGGQEGRSPRIYTPSDGGSAASRRG